MEEKKLEEKLRGLVIFTEGDGQGQATNTTLEEELGEYAMQKVLDLFSQELDRAREEGYQNCMDDIWEKARGLRSWTEHDGSVSAGDIEAGLREAYLEIEEELSKLTTK